MSQTVAAILCFLAVVGGGALCGDIVQPQPPGLDKKQEELGPKPYAPMMLALHNVGQRRPEERPYEAPVYPPHFSPSDHDPGQQRAVPKRRVPRHARVPELLPIRQGPVITKH